MKESHEYIKGQMLELERILCRRAMEFKDTIVMGRTHQQHAVPVTFGFVLAVWAGEIADHIDRAQESEKRWLFGSLSGAAGAQNAFVELCGIETTRKLADMVCKKLGLDTPMIDLHTRTDRFAEVVTNLAELCSSLAEFGSNIGSWQMSEVMEAEEPYDCRQYSSSTMPNKVNPEPSEQIHGLAAITRSLALAVQSISMPGNRDATRITIEYAAIPMTYMMTSRALESMIGSVSGLIVHEDKMLENLFHPNVLGQAAAERLMIAMYEKSGQKNEAHTLLHEYSRQSREKRIHLKDLLLEDEYMSRIFSREELEKLFDLTTYTGTAAHQTEEFVKFLLTKRAGRQ
jgi:adenylosuccinate lyase